jgi:hypothetical protein
MWIYHYPEKSQAVIHCSGDKGQRPRTETLQGAGSIHNASNCSIATNDNRKLLHLQGSSRANFLSPQFYVPEKIPVMAEHEVKLLQEATPAATGRLDEIQAHLAARSQTFDVDALLHMHQSSLHQASWNHCFLVFTSTFGTVLILSVFIFITFPSLRTYPMQVPKTYFTAA